MTHPLHRHEKKLGPTFVLSLTCHLVFIVIFTQFHLLTSLRLQEAPVYHVDLVNLPVADPRAGNPAAEAAAPLEPVPARQEEMKVPAQKAPEKAAKTAAPPRQAPDPANGAQEFEERMKRLQQQADASHQAAALEALKRKVAGVPGGAGIPGAPGKESGSDYSGYIRSRLEDAFRREDTFKPDRSKVVAVRLSLNRSGRISALKIIQNSPDPMFNEAVMRAISLAERDFRPPPGGGTVDFNFIFKPQEVSKK